MQRQSGTYMVLHADLFVRSMDVALDFYCNKLGFLLVDDAMVRGPLIQWISSGICDTARLVLLRVSSVGAMIELQEFQAEGALSGGSQERPNRISLVSILVANLDSHISRVRSRGLKPTSEVFLVTLPRQGSCHVVFYEDPDGNQIEFLEVQQPAPSSANRP
jgi:catechol 2,3-dioxygenase-like lactoylglutathione lyase family enzyme